MVQDSAWGLRGTNSETSFHAGESGRRIPAAARQYSGEDASVVGPGVIAPKSEPRFELKQDLNPRFRGSVSVSVRAASSQSRHLNVWA
jgi:hypothetical protein